MNLFRKFTICMAFVLAPGPAILSGQTGRATITGIVTDATGAVVPGVTVTVTGAETGVTYPATTNSVGTYTVANLPIGSYSVLFSAPGFKELNRAGITLVSGQVARLDIVLDLGAVTEKLSVTAEAPLVQTETAQSSKSVDAGIFKDLPLAFGAGRNMAAFADKLVPGVSGSAWNMKIQGTPSATASVVIDGMSSLAGFLPGDFSEVAVSPEAIQEMTVFTGNSNAEFGRTGGGTMNFILKSGANQLHGSAFYYLQNEILNANDWNNNRLLAADPTFKSASTRNFLRPKNRKNDYGFSFGGPVWIPKIYDGRNRTFFYFTLEKFGYQTVGPTSLSQTVPLPEMWNGDLSRLLTGRAVGTDPLGRQVYEGQIFDPTTLREYNGQFVSDVFPGNIIPASRISNVARNLKTIFGEYYMPVTNDLTNNQYGTRWYKQNVNQGTVKLDHSISSRHKVSGFYYWHEFPRYMPDGGIWSITDPTGGGPMAKNRLQQRHGSSWNVSHDWVVTPALLNHASFGSNINYNDSTGPTIGQGWDKTLGIQGSGSSLDASRVTVPYLNLGSSPVTSMTMPWGQDYQVIINYHSYILNDTLTWQRGRHTLKAGLEITHMAGWQDDSGNGSGGYFNFSSRTTGMPGQSFSSRVGHSFASLLLGLVDSASVGVGFMPKVFRNSYAAFVQDDWKVTRRLTLNLGLRWNGDSPLVEGQDRIANFNPYLPDPNANNMLGAVEYMGTGPGRTGRRSPSPGYYRNFGPTFGLAYQINPETVLRAGYGITYTPESIGTAAEWGMIPGGFTAGFATRNAVDADSKGIYRPVFNIDDGYPGTPTQPYLDISWGQKRGSTRLSPDMYKAGYVQHFNFGLQRQFGKDLVIEAAWRASKGTRLPSGGNVRPNQIHKEELYRGAVLGQVIDTPAKAAAAGLPYPYAGWSGIGANTLMPFPQINTKGLTAYADPLGFTNYQSGNLIVTKRMSKSVMAYGAYTFSKTISNVGSVLGAGDSTGIQDTYERTKYKTIDGGDRTHVLKASTTWELPVGRNRALLKGLHPVWNAVLGGWSVAAILGYSSGTPIGTPSSRTTPVGWNGPGVLSNFATPAGGFERVFNPATFNPWNANDPGNRFFNPAPFSDALPQQLGNSPIRFPQIRGLWRFNEDASILKNFTFKERGRMELRVELFNVFNRHFFGSPDMNMNNAYFGNVRTASGARSGQAGVRVEW